MRKTRCPDCDVSMETAEYMNSLESKPLKLKSEREDVLGSLGFGGETPLEVVVCPECKLVRFYAVTDE